MADSEAHIRHFLGPGSKIIVFLVFNLTIIISGISWPSTWPENTHFEIPEDHFGNASGPWSELWILKIEHVFLGFNAWLQISFVSNSRLAKWRKPTAFWPLGFTVFFVFYLLKLFLAICPRSWLRNFDSASCFQFRLSFQFPGPWKLSIFHVPKHVW